MTKTFILCNSDAKFHANGIELCCSVMDTLFPEFKNVKRLRLTISNVRQHRKGEFKLNLKWLKLDIPRVQFRKSKGAWLQVFMETHEVVRRFFPTETTLFVQFTPL